MEGGGSQFERSIGPTGPVDGERVPVPASRATRQLILLACDGVLARMPPSRADGDIADELVRERVLPGCYRPRYDDRFLFSFRGITELVRNLLVSDPPFVPDTMGELAAHALLDQAAAILDARGEGWQPQAAEIHEGLPGRLSGSRAELADELESLRGAVLEDLDVLLLFELPADEDPIAHLAARLRPEDRELLRFENWRVPFGNVPRPQV